MIIIMCNICYTEYIDNVYLSPCHNKKRRPIFHRYRTDFLSRCDTPTHISPIYRYSSFGDVSKYLPISTISLLRITVKSRPTFSV